MGARRSSRRWSSDLVLEAEDPVDRGLDPRLVNAAAAHESLDDVERPLDDIGLVHDLVGDEEDVDPRLDGEGNGLLVAVRIGDRAHLEVVTDDDPIEPEPL